MFATANQNANAVSKIKNAGASLPNANAVSKIKNAGAACPMRTQSAKSRMQAQPAQMRA